MSDFASIYEYILKREFKTATSISIDNGNNEALVSFTAFTASAPTSSVMTVPTTSKHNFLFY